MFVKDVARSAADEALVKGVIEIGHGLGRSVVAEGVEDAATLEKLSVLGCDVAQGFFLARPMPEDELEAWLTARAGTA